MNRQYLSVDISGSDSRLNVEGSQEIDFLHKTTTSSKAKFEKSINYMKVDNFENLSNYVKFNNLSDSRYKSVVQLFEDSPDNIKRTIYEYSNRLKVESTLEGDYCHYDTSCDTIRMNDNMDDEEYAEVFSHEYGHFVDYQKGNISYSSNFREAIISDLKQYDKSSSKGGMYFDKMLDNLMNSDAVYDRAVSDNMSALFMNDLDVIERYREEGVGYYQHYNSYWKELGNREAEIFANLFSISAQGNTDSCNFMKSFFPKTFECFNKFLEEKKNEFY